MDSRLIINSTIMLLAIFVASLSMFFIWDSYQTHRTSNNLQHANHIIDNSIDAAGLQALERGITSAALGMPAPINNDFYARIQSVRNKGDKLWNTTISKAEILTPNIPENHNYITVMQKSQLAFEQLTKMRKKVDEYITAKNPTPIKLTDWVKTSTALINTEYELRELTFNIVSMRNKASNIDNAIKRRIWRISEYAGLERAHIGFFLATRQPIPDDTLHQLHELRGVVEHGFEDLEFGIKIHPEVDERIKQSIKQMQRVFFQDFQLIRKEIYAAASSGNYPYTAEQWIDKATFAINSILAVGRTVSKITEDGALSISRNALFQLILNIIIITITLTITAISLIKVRQTVNDLFHQKELAEVTLHSIGDAVITTDAKANIEYLNPVAEELTGWTNNDAAGLPLSNIFLIKNAFTLQVEPNPIERCLQEGAIVGLGSNITLTRRDGSEIMIEDSAAPIKDLNNKTVGAVIVFYDVTAMRNTPHLLSYHATHDTLTGLYNRREFERQLADLIIDAKNNNSEHALCYIDLDQFKIINDTSGHVAGDKLLQQLSYLFKKHVRDTDMIARLGGDEFGLLLQNCHLDKAIKIAEAMRKVIKDFRFSWDDKTFEFGASIGLVPINTDSVSPAEIMSESDAACYAAKEKGRNRIQVYQAGDLELAQRHGEMQWVSRINEAINEDRMVLYAQPIVSLDNDQNNYFEILLRLVDKDNSVIEPMAFIPAAERYNLMPDIDYLVIKKSIELLSRNKKISGIPADKTRLSINLSGSTLGKDDLLDYIKNLLEIHNVPRKSICFEITETAAISNLEHAASFIKELRKEGCCFALDDFGSGLCSFSYLKTLPVDYLKIDGTFIQNIKEDMVNYAIVKSAASIAKVLKMQTIAEYVEDAGTIEILRELGVNYAQGFGIGRPEPAENWTENRSNLYV